MSSTLAKDIKILATLGPASMCREKIEAMDRDGVDIFRLNLSHTALDVLPRAIEAIQGWTHKPLCLDSEGAQVRTGRFDEPGWATLEADTTISLTDASVSGNGRSIPLYPIQPARVLRVGDVLHLDFDSAVVQVVGVENEAVRAWVLCGGKVASNKAVSIDRDVPLDPFTAKDEQAFEIGAELGVTHFAFSFASGADGVRLLRSRFAYPVTIISKIESRQGLENLSGIARESDALLIDRGDLSRDIPVQKIGLAQLHIIDTARAARVPVYVATNLLETMVTHRHPRRGEINDITASLLSRIDGLVLAAETAIGDHPVEAVRMIAGIVRQTRRYLDLGPGTEKVDFLSAYPEHEPIPPHGGVLVHAHVDARDVADLDTLPDLVVDERGALDLVQIADGVYSPVTEFMDAEQLRSVLERYRLSNGVAWTLPIILQVRDDAARAAARVAGGSASLLIRGPDGVPCGVLHRPKLERIDMRAVAKRWFGTDSDDHAGVRLFYARGDAILSGEVRALGDMAAPRPSHCLSPEQTRRLFQQFGWKRIVGFHTRNVLHRGHEHIQRMALTRAGADALLISPVIGPKKAGDFTPETIIAAYETMLALGGYRPFAAMLNCLRTYPRYAGVREAVFTALCRQNYGCTHFVIGRDHSGVGSRTDKDLFRRMFESLGDVAITPLFFDAVYHCVRCGESTVECDHGADARRSISGSAVREHLLAGTTIPEHLVRPEIGDLLRRMRDEQRPVFEETDG